MEDTNNETLIRSFSEITSATRDEALFFLESHNWDLDSAVSTFFDNSASATAIAPSSLAQPQPHPHPHPQQPIPPSPDSPPYLSDSSQRSRSQSPPRSPYQLRSRQDKKKVSMGSSSKGKKVGGIRTFADLNRSAQDDSGSDSDDPQEYYTGGEKSGMLVQDPTRGRDVDSIFDQARQAGAEAGDSVVAPSSASRSFTGTGRLLSGDAVAAAPAQAQQPEPLTHTIYFWRNGFSVDDGPLRRMDDPQNAPFLESIMKSECPKELEPADRRTPVHVSLMRRDENYSEPEKPKLPFQGVGRTLGSTSSDVSVAAQAAPPPAPLHSAPTPSAGLVIDQNAPLTSIQIRLADGTRMVSRFNHNHTIGDIRAFINASRPGTSTTYQLQSMGFPPKQLLDANQTIEQAGLANSVVIQRL